MANEATVTIVAKMRDEATEEMAELGQTTAQTTQEAFNFQLALTAAGSALTAVGSLINQIDNPMAKMGANFLMITGAVMSTSAAILVMIPYIKQLITWLRALAVVQTIVAALTGPLGWARIAAGLAIAGGAAAGIYAMTGGFGGGGGTTTYTGTPAPGVAPGGGVTTEININAGTFMGNEADARRFAGMIDRNIKSDRGVGR
jgi:hypothetical protein